MHQKGDLLSEREFSAVLNCFGYHELGSSWLFKIINSQDRKSADVVDATTAILKRHHFNEHAKILQGMTNHLCELILTVLIIH